MQRVRLALLLAFAFAASVEAQVDVYYGPSANIARPAIDFDNPPVPGGPLQPGVLAGTGIRSVMRVGTGWPYSGTFPGYGYADRMLVSQNGVASVWLPGQAAEWLAAGDGWEIELDAPVDEFQMTFTGATPRQLRAELFLGATSLGVGEVWSPSDPAPFFLRSPLGPFDRLRLEAATGATGPRGIDDLAFGFGPAPVRPSNDECVTALPVMQGVTMFSTRHATPSPEPVSLILSQYGDVWFEYTVVGTGNDLRLDVCGASFAAAMEVYVGSCGALGTPHHVGPNVCFGGGSLVLNHIVAGDKYLLRIGSGSLYFAEGTGTLGITESPPPPVPLTCLETLFAADGVTAPGGAVYFDVDAGDELEVTALEFNTPQLTPTTQHELRVYTVPGTWTGNAGNPGGAGWTHVGTAHGYGRGLDQRSIAQLAQTFVLSQGTHGVALVAGPNLQLAHSLPTATNQQAASGDGYLTLTAGAADDVPWSGALQGARVWNGRLCAMRVDIGVRYCISTPNSTGLMALLDARGSDVLLYNDLRLELRQLPINVFLFFLTSATPGFLPHAGGSLGNLCLGGAIGRYVGPGQIKNSGTTGTAELSLDLTTHPTPTGFVSVQQGETWHFQAWYRDSGFSVPFHNFSDATAVTFR